MRIEGESPAKKVEMSESDGGNKKELNFFEMDDLRSKELEGEASSLRETHDKKMEELLRDRELHIGKMQNAEKVISLRYADLQIAEITGVKPEEKAEIKKRIEFLERAVSYFDDEIVKVEKFDYSDDLKEKSPDLATPLDRLHEKANRENVRRTYEQLLLEGVGRYSKSMQSVYDHLAREGLALQIGEEEGNKNFDEAVNGIVKEFKDVLSNAWRYQRDSITKKMRELEGNSEWKPVGFSGTLPGRLFCDLQDRIEEREREHYSNSNTLNSLWHAVAPKMNPFAG